MRVAVTSEGEKLEDAMDWRFGRCRYFVIIDTATMQVEAVENIAVNDGGGAGVHAVRQLAEHGAEVVVTGRCGPNAFRALQAAGVAVYTDANGTVGDCLQNYFANELTLVQQPSAESHSGTRNPSTA
jgi:predicted Fe-Mo cluster-binding NifX family protein